MSKFEEMCKSFTDARNSWTAYRDRCYKHISSLSTGFVKYCGLPDDTFQFVPAKDSEAGKQYSPFDAIQFDDSDAHWHWGWRITLYESPSTFPRLPVVVTLALRESEEGKVMVKRGWEQDAVELDLKTEDQCAIFYDGIVERIQIFFRRTPQHFGGDSRPEKIGFSID